MAEDDVVRRSIGCCWEGVVPALSPMRSTRRSHASMRPCTRASVYAMATAASASCSRDANARASHASAVRAGGSNAAPTREHTRPPSPLAAKPAHVGETRSAPPSAGPSSNALSSAPSPAPAESIPSERDKAILGFARGRCGSCDDAVGGVVGDSLRYALLPDRRAGCVVPIEAFASQYFLQPSDMYLCCAFVGAAPLGVQQRVFVRPHNAHRPALATSRCRLRVRAAQGACLFSP